MSLRRSLLPTFAILALAAPAQAGKKESYAYGPAPDWETYKALAEKAVLAKMPDPDNWQVVWPSAYVKAAWRQNGLVPGYMTCGVLQAIDPSATGRYFLNFAVVVDYGVVKVVDIAKANNSAPSMICPALIKRGMLPPASTMKQSADIAVDALGLTIRVMPEGAYVVAVVDGSPAKTAGLTPGMLIAKVNGVALAGLDAAMTKLLDNSSGSRAIELATGETLTLVKP